MVILEKFFEIESNPEGDLPERVNFFIQAGSPLHAQVTLGSASKSQGGLG